MIKYRILPEHELVVLCLRDSTDEQEVLALSAVLTNDEKFSYDYDALVDNTYLDHTVSGQELRELVERDVPHMGPHSKLAIVAPADLTYGVSRMHQLLSEYRVPTRIEVFRDRRSALEWLGRAGLGLEDLCDELGQEA